jgi:hypothetical protein
METREICGGNHLQCRRVGEANLGRHNAKVYRGVFGDYSTASYKAICGGGVEACGIFAERRRWGASMADILAVIG